MSDPKKQKRGTGQTETASAVGWGNCGCVRGFRLCPEALKLWEAAELAHAEYLAADESARLDALRSWDRAQAAFGFHAPVSPPLRG